MNIFEELKEYCENGIIFRKDIGKITGGMLNSHTMAHMDQKGIGVKNYFYVGHRVAYKVQDVINWLKENSELINFSE